MTLASAILSGAAAAKRRTTTLSPTAGALRLLGVAPTLTRTALVAPTTGAIRFVGVTPAFTGGALASVEVGAIEWNAQYNPVAVPTPQPAILRITGIAPTVSTGAASEATISGTLQAHHSIFVDVEGPAASYSQADPTTWRNYRYQVTFTKGATTIGPVPGIFFADGDPGNTEATSGKIWRCIFRPPEAGTWHYTVSFTTGTDVALVLPDTPSGTGLGMDGDEGDIVVAESAAFGDRSLFQPNLGRPAFIASGNYLRHERNADQYFLFAGPGSRENMLADTDFTATSRVGGGTLPGWAPHVTHWRGASGSRPADPTWVNGVRGKGAIGAMNYIADKGNNTIYSLLMNAGIVGGVVSGDAKDCYPYPAATASDPRDVFSCAKMHQWFMYYEWCNKRGIWPTVYFYEQENYGCLDNNSTNPTTFGPLSKLHARTMTALLGSLYLGWVVSEETGGLPPLVQGDIDYLQAFADYLDATQAYPNPIGAHNNIPNLEAAIWDPMVNRSSFHMANLQATSNQDVNTAAALWTGATKSVTPPWIFEDAEQANHMMVPDGDAFDPTHDNHRKLHLYDGLTGRGSGIHAYAVNSDQTLADYTVMSAAWDQYRWAMQAWQDYIPFHQCAPDNTRIQGGAPASTRCFRKTGECYVVYQRGAGAVTLSLSGETGTWRQDRISPVAATSLTNVSTSLAGGGNVALGDPGGEALTIVTKTGIAPTIRRIMLVNATTDVDIGPLFENCVIDTDVVGTSLAFRAVTSPGVVGSVVFSGTAVAGNTESVAPYASPGDTAGSYNNWTVPADGEYTITATPKTQAGVDGTPLTITFVLNQAVGGGAELVQYGGETVEYGGEQVEF